MRISCEVLLHKISLCNCHFTGQTTQLTGTTELGKQLTFPVIGKIANVLNII